MGCFHPIRLRSHLEADKQLTVGCGKCLGCKLERSRQWAVRIMHEASLYEDNCLLTLTYDNEHLPERGSLDRAAFPKFMKRLRKEIEPRRVRFFHAGEYGSLFKRPHYHAIIFNFDFPDKYNYSVRGGFPVWRSASLEKLWPMGRSEIGSVTFESAAYVARYLVKTEAQPHERLDLETGEVLHLTAEYCTMSRRPGIASAWVERFGGEVFAADSVIVRGRECKPPRFYDLQFELVEPGQMEFLREMRRRRRRLSNLGAAEANAQSRFSLLKRGLE